MNIVLLMMMKNIEDEESSSSIEESSSSSGIEESSSSSVVEESSSSSVVEESSYWNILMVTPSNKTPIKDLNLNNEEINSFKGLYFK